LRFITTTCLCNERFADGYNNNNSWNNNNNNSWNSNTNSWNNNSMNNNWSGNTGTIVNQCTACPEGTRPSTDNTRCVDVGCDKDQIFRDDLQCPQCEWCPPGTIPDPTRRFCIVKPRPPINVNGLPTCDEFSVFSLDKSECMKCPNGLKSSRDSLRCMSTCTDELDIVQEDGSCFSCM